MNTRTSFFWTDLSRAWLHDPIDKALNIPDHENRATEMQHAFLGEAVNDARDGEGSKPGDIVSSILERFPLPDFRKSKADTTISRSDLQRVCPVTGEKKTVSTSGLTLLSEGSPALRHLEMLKDAFPNDMRLRYLALWRFFPHLMDAYRELPADTRLRDHSIVDHCDMCASTAAAYYRIDGKGSSYHNAGLLTFSLGPVQSQIAAARSVRDLWSGSYILSWLTFHAMLPIIERYGPQSIVFPALRESPLMDAWLQGQFEDKLPEKCTLQTQWSDLRAAAYPNTFQAMVSMEDADDMRQACNDAIAAAWKKMATAVHNTLDTRWKSQHAGWSQGWEQQIDNTWDCRVQVTDFLPPQSKKRTEHMKELHEKYTTLLGEKPEHIQGVQALTECLADRDHLAYSSRETATAQAGLWMLGSEMAGRRLWADKQVRHIPADENDTRHKCSLYGTWAAMGPEKNKDFRAFWKDAPALSGKNIIGMLKPGEHLCATALVKRFAWGCAIAPQLIEWDCAVKISDNAIPDTHSLCTAWWRPQVQKAAPQEWDDYDRALQKLRLSEEIHGYSEGTHSEDLYACLLPTNKSESSWLQQEAPPQVASILKNKIGTLLNKRKNLVNAARTANPELGPPRSYYAILVADGDDMGKWLRGDQAMLLKDAYHPQIVNEYFLNPRHKPSQSLKKTLDNCRRPLTPASQAAFSATLTKFSHSVSHTLFKPGNKYGASLVYAGGDDVLAILPIEQALQAASALNNAWRRALPGATLSAGLVMVHHLSDLRSAMDAARAAEKQAKESGKNKLCWSVLRRSGDTTTCSLPWDTVSQCQDNVTSLRNGSNGWIARLIQEKTVLQGLADDPDCKRMIGQRIKYLLKHSSNSDSYGSEVFDWWATLADKNFDNDLDAFIACCENMQFLARSVDAG